MKIVKKNKDKIKWIIIGLIIFSIFGGIFDLGYKDPQSVIQSFTPTATCNEVGGFLFTAEDRALCNQKGCYVSNDYSFTDMNVFYGIVGGSTLLITGAVATGLCGAITPYISWACANAATATVAVSGSILLTGGIATAAHALDTTCESCLADGVITSNGASCCSGYSKTLDRSVFTNIVIGSPKLCIPASVDGGNPPIDNEGFMCNLGTPLTKMLGLDDCITGAYFTIGGIIMFLILLIALFI